MNQSQRDKITQIIRYKNYVISLKSEKGLIEVWGKKKRNSRTSEASEVNPM